MPESRRARVFALVGAMLALTAVDLVQKAFEPVYGHPRGLGYVVLAVVLAVFLVAIVPRVPSLLLSVAGGVAAAGALGNAVSAVAWFGGGGGGGVPNPIVMGAVAFNVADICAVAGALGLVAGAALHALRHPELLREPI
jgi:lipoprotein signal peptidase